MFECIMIMRMRIVLTAQLSLPIFLKWTVILSKQNTISFFFLSFFYFGFWMKRDLSKFLWVSPILTLKVSENLVFTLCFHLMSYSRVQRYWSAEVSQDKYKPGFSHLGVTDPENDLNCTTNPNPNVLYPCVHVI